jgi:hypothetical protein
LREISILRQNSALGGPTKYKRIKLHSRHEKANRWIDNSIVKRKMVKEDKIGNFVEASIDGEWTRGHRFTNGISHEIR